MTKIPPKTCRCPLCKAAATCIDIIHIATEDGWLISYDYECRNDECMLRQFIIEEGRV